MSRPLVFLVDDDDDFRKSTRWLLQSAGHQVRDYDCATAFLDDLGDGVSTPGSTCVVSDIRMPGMSGLELQQALNQRADNLPLVLITGHGDIPMAVQAIQRGAVDFIEKPFDESTLFDAIERAAQTATQSASVNIEAQQKVQALTPREREVLDLVIRGKANKVIADALRISIKTVEMHRSNMRSKLGVRSLPALMQLAFDAGLQTPKDSS